MFSDIKTERLTLKPLAEDDRAAAVEILMDETVGKTYMVPESISEEMAVRLFRRLRELSLSDNHYVAGIYLDDGLIGWINDTEIQDGVIKVGYVIHPRYHGHGYMTEALQAVMRDLFEKGYKEIVAGAFEENKASIRVMEKCGLTKLDRQDEIEYRGQKHRCVYYSTRRDKMKIALASVRIIDRDISYNLSQMEHITAEAKLQGAELVCFGESFLQGFECLDWDYNKDKHMAVTVDSECFASVCELSRRIQIDVLFGFIERDGETLYSSCALISEGQLYHLYRRISRGWKEFSRTDDHYREGNSVIPFLYKGRKCVIGLCGDLWDYPERFALGEDLLFWPVYVDWTPEEWEEGAAQEYADQANLCCAHTLYVNSICDGDARGGAAYFVNGTVKEELPMGEEGLLLVEV